MGAGVGDTQARQEAELDRLLRHRIGARDHRLAGDHGGDGGEPYQRQSRPVRRHAEERIVDRRRIVEQQRRLAEIVEQQAGEGDIEPRHTDRLAAEMPHVGVERLGPRHRQHHRAQREKSELGIEQEEVRRPPGVHRAQDAGIPNDAPQPHRADHHEIEQHDWPEHEAHLGGAARLDEEQADQDHQRGRHHEWREAVVHHLQPLDRGEHRDRRRNDRVAVEERGRQHTQQHDAARPLGLVAVADDQREQRQAAPLAVIVRAHRDEDVLDRHDQRHRPENQAEHTEDVRPVDQQRVWPREALLERIERRGTDIAEDYADRAQRQRHQLLPAGVGVRGVCGGMGGG